MPKLSGLEQVHISDSNASQQETRWFTCAPAVRAFYGLNNTMPEVSERFVRNQQHNTMHATGGTCPLADRRHTLPAQVHESLCSLTGLTELDMQFCGIRAVSPCVSILKNLRSLQLSNNKFAEVRLSSTLMSLTCTARRSVADGDLACIQVPQELSSLTQFESRFVQSQGGTR